MCYAVGTHTHTHTQTQIFGTVHNFENLPSLALWSMELIDSEGNPFLMNYAASGRIVQPSGSRGFTLFRIIINFEYWNLMRIGNSNE